MENGKWWHTQNEEHLNGPCATREEAIEEGRGYYGGESFLICEGKRFRYQAIAFDIERIAEDFDDANILYGPEDEGPSAAWSDDACKELERALEATMDAWLDKHGYRDAHAIDAREYERIEAQVTAIIPRDQTSAGAESA